MSKKAGGVKAILKMSQYEVFVIAHLCGTCEHCKTEDSKNFRYCDEIKKSGGTPVKCFRTDYFSQGLMMNPTILVCLLLN